MSPRLARRSQSLFVVLAWSLLPVAPVAAVVVPQESAREALFLRHPDLHIANVYQPPGDLAPDLAAALASDLASLGAAPERAFYDLRGGRWGTLVLRRPLIPGSGKGNRLAWTDLGLAPPSGAEQVAEAARAVFAAYVATVERELGIDPAELAPRPGVTVHEGGRLIQIHVPRAIGGVPVRDSYLTAVVNGGNLVLFGARNWGEADIATQPLLAAEEAATAVERHVAQGEFTVAGTRRPSRLEIVPLARGEDLAEVVPGSGYDYRLVWVVSPTLGGDRGSWEGLVDAMTGELLAFTDRNQYFDSKITGGVYPVSNDGIPPDGVERPGFPMPFADVVLPFGTATSSNSAGLVTGIGGTLRTTLAGPFVRMHDFCGPIDEVALCSELDLGAGPGTDCVVPPGRSPGDTHASRSGFYEVNRIVETARGYLPDNPWLGQQLTANMNIGATCNAFWDGQTINFYQSGGGCANTGEIAAVFDHEWGHGLDNNGADPSISAPGESIADIYAILRLADSCLGRGFLPGETECNALLPGLGGYGDPCLDCSGIRQLDFAGHQSGEPHDLDWILSPLVGPGGGCVGVPPLQTGPCGQETHCEGMVPAEAGWDLYARDLQAAPFSFDSNTALELATRLFYQGAGTVGDWYQCAPGESGLAGCNADGGYLNLLAVDDDNGDLTDGTPHMQAIFGAFDRHQIACSAPAVVNFGCAGGPTAAPSLVVTAGPQSAQLSWNAVPGAVEYRVFRTEGVRGCDFGKVLIGETAGTQFADTGLLDGFEYLYSVLAVGASERCTGPMGPCASVVPLAKEPEEQAVLAFRETQGLQIVTGDGDDFLDNCEVSNFSFAVENGGTVDLHDVRLVSVTSPSHPGIDVLTALPLALADTLPGGACGLPETVAPASFSFVPEGMGFDEAIELTFRIEATSLEFGPLALEGTVSFSGVESDFSFVAQRTFGYETDLEGWRVVSGTYTRETPGAAGTEFHLASSAFLAGQCDEIQSPEIRLTETSTLQLFSQFSIEPESTDFFDRANVGLLDVASGNRTTVAPDGGRTYNAAGPNGVCVTQGQPGWAGAGPGFLPSIWSAEALRSAEFAGKRVRLDVAYGTDPSVELQGFQFDELTLTDFELQSPDAASNVCPAPPDILANDDEAETLVDTPVTIAVLANDFTVSPPLGVVSMSDPANGTALANGDGTITYLPDADFDGTDGFGYTVQDAAARTASATVTVTVIREAEPPPPACELPGVEVASDPVGDTAAVAGGDPSLDITSVAFAEPFLGPGAEKLVVTLEVVDLTVPHPSAAWRTFWTSPDGVTYFVALESCDPTVGLVCSHGTFDGTFFTSEGEPEGCEVDPNGSIVITVDKALVGIDDATDGGAFLAGINGRTQVFLGALCTGALAQADNAGPASYPIFTNAACGGGRPIAADDAASTPLNTTATIDVLANDFDPEGAALTVASVGQPANGTATNNGADVTYTPNNGFLGSDSFEYAACDPDGLCDAATVAVEVHCPAQPAGGLSDDFEPGAEAGWTVETARNDNPASFPWVVAVDPFTHSPTHAFVSDATTLVTKDDRLIAPPQNLSPTSHLVFWHRFVFEGSFDGGVLEVSTDGGNTWVDVETGGGTFLEGGYNGSISSSAGSPIAGRPAWTDFSEFLDAMTRVEVDLGAFAGDDVRVRWRLAADPFAPGALPGIAWWIDDVEFTDTLAVPDACPLPPDAVGDTAQTVRDAAVAIDVLANDSDPNGDPLVVGRADAASVEGGTVTHDGTDVTYDPPAGFTGSDSFTYDACDPGGLCDSATVVVLVELGPSEPVKATGAGWIPDGAGGKANFGFNADSTAAPPKGRITYESPAGVVKIKGTVSSVSLLSPTEAEFSGSCQLQHGAPCTYDAAVEDNAEPGAGGDRFRIEIFDTLGQPIHQADELLGGGNIQIH